ncbi:aldo/keto reductase [Arthrobacter sp. zg-Y820]|uniref:aldo/keto reductase n=1 Tax=unclassified Arthrobacter TaxID=235627 RepID=UPI001E4BDD18|nr:MULTISPECIES: aldo/keto reductase [unclassified Arthrobacter]MCC9198587.1 aldo/keto reductase [Arthrobacter sp. zg-Y820]MDK1281457.1 aldo/keto reductase [Arthrobacter sp. zg.Y820]WIB09899.1 aldo/keto reductase [Arthrobacter sp. zg-Y820]
MRYVKLGSSGAIVSAVGLGCMTFGDPGRGNHGWTLPGPESRPILRRALDLGINFFDTANVYSAGDSEAITGAALVNYAKREEVVIATKVRGEMAPGPNGWGLSRKHILWQVDESLRRLGTDYIDLYQVHRWDGSTPLEEVLETLDGLVRAGKVRYLGASTMYAWQFARALTLQHANGWSPFVTMQAHYNLVYREEEREMIPLCEATGTGVLAYSPLARGRLARGWDRVSRRQQQDELGHSLYSGQDVPNSAIADAGLRVAQRHGVPRAQVALAWVLTHPTVTAPVLGASAVDHLDDAVAALDLRLSPEDLEELEQDYTPRHVAGF